MANSNILAYIIVAIVSFVILYYIIKNAVKWGVIEAKDHEKANPPTNKNSIPDTQNLSPKQKNLQRLYEKGEITIEQYREWWDKV